MYERQSLLRFIERAVTVKSGANSPLMKEYEDASVKTEKLNPDR